MKEVLTHATTWMSLDAMLSETSHHKDKSTYMQYLEWSIRKRQS